MYPGGRHYKSDALTSVPLECWLLPFPYMHQHMFLVIVHPQHVK